ncbi:MAG: hypothetical protein ACM3NI_12050 [Bacteroidota bacterium]
MQLPGIPLLNVTGDVARLKHIPCIHEMRFHHVKTRRLDVRQDKRKTIGRGDRAVRAHPDEREQSGAATLRWKWKSANGRRADHTHVVRRNGRKRSAVNDAAGAELLRAGKTEPAGGFEHYQPRSPDHTSQTDGFAKKKQIV